MSIEVRVPTLGESIVDAVIARWLKHEGDTVTQGEALVELETDKVNVEVTADQGGVLQEIARQEGETVAVGDLLGVIGTGRPQGIAPTMDNFRKWTGDSYRAVRGGASWKSCSGGQRKAEDAFRATGK